MRTIEFEGVKVEYDERCVLSYKWQKAANSGDTARIMGAVERLLCGRDEEYADALSKSGDDMDDSMELMGKLLGAVIEDMGRTAKN